MPIFLLIIKRIFNFILIVDAHNAGLFPLEGKYLALNKLSSMIQKKADLTIVTNSALENIVKNNGGRAFVLPDKLPDIPNKEKMILNGNYNFMLVCSFSKDEPFIEAISAFSQLPNSFYLYITGDFRKVANLPIRIPANIIFTGYLPDEEYFKLLGSVDAVINLTLRDNCLLCGAYETVAAEKILILSDKRALREYFCKCAVFVKNTPNGIRNGILKVVEQNDNLSNQMKSLKNKLAQDWQHSWEDLELIIESLYRGTHR